MSEPLTTAEHAEFIRRVRAGDEEAAAELVRRYEAEIRLEVRTWLRLRSPNLRRVFDSMDICQSVLASFFVRAAVGEFDLDQPQQLIQLLVGMARHKLNEQVKYHQRHRRDVRRTSPADAGDCGVAAAEETPSAVVARGELLAEFRKRLTEEERGLADLRAEGWDWGTIATKVGGTPEACRKQLSRAIDRVERELGLNAGA
jgi:DNA-directed RNA polymerase specialized sigma24 family protein